MKISLNWLKDYIDLPKNLTPEKVAEDLTMATVEVESVINQSQQFEKMVVGKVAELKKHPNADKLKISLTDVGQRNPVQIVCGGKNLKEGMLVAVALPGAKVRWHGEGEPVILKETKIRGEKSFGMICAADEIGLENMFPCGLEEIVDLSALASNKVSQPVAKKGAGYETSAQQGGIKPGLPLVRALNLDDVVFEIDNKSLTNRPDLWSHYGIARELAAIYKIKLKEINPDTKTQKHKNTKTQNLKIEIKNKSLCSRYIGCLVENIEIMPSPVWLQKRLEAIGLRAINNIVDITNYVMLDVGEPTHAFDVASLHADKRGWQRGLTRIIIRKARKGEKIKTLDGEVRQLDESMLVITDGKKPVALAGVMGGAECEIDEKTKDIVLEAANFDAISIRKTSQKLNHRTESSIRFEKSLDPNLAEIAMLRILELIKKVYPGAKINTLADTNYYQPKDIKINIEHSFIEKKIGQEFNSKEIIDILKRLGFVVETRHCLVSTDDINYLVSIPSWRATGDISIPEDVVEEVARIYGYDNLKPKTEKVELTKAKYQLEFELEKKIKDYLSLGCGMSEVFNYAWAEEKYLKRLGKYGKMIELENPPSEENRYLQNSLIPNLIKNIEDNLRYFDEFKIFELARVFYAGNKVSPPSSRLTSGLRRTGQPVAKGAGYETCAQQWGSDDRLPDQPKMLAGSMVSKNDAFLETKGILEGMALELVSSDEVSEFLNKNKYLEVVVGKEKIGWLGEYKDKINNKNIALFEINFNKFVGTRHGAFMTKKYQPLPQYPSIERDLAFELKWGIKWSDVQTEILRPDFIGTQDKIIKNIIFLSEYDLGSKKSIAFRVIYQADRTLKDEEVEVVEKEIIKMVEKRFRGRLRK